MKRGHSYHGVALMVLVAIAASVASAATQDASANTISGTVKTFDRNGEEASDHSGVVIFIDGLQDNARFSWLPVPPQVSHKNRIFLPAVLPIVQGTTVDFYNDDNVYHNVFSLSESKTFDLGIYPEGTSKLVKFSRPGLVMIHCNIHPKMTSSILVLNNSLFSKTGPDGSFEIRGIPDGQFTLRLWSEFSDQQSRIVSLSGSRRYEESFDVQVTKRFLQHKNKFGKRYREKY